MQFLAEIILTIIFEYLLQIPGAIVRWAFHLGKVPFKKLLNEENTLLNVIISIGILILIIAIRIIYF